ncbi:MAG: hypothetical protein GTO03_14950 [Planctomycetales bacterium]|nr:hypothetical protein [Planctomycetales bacterium]
MSFRHVTISAASWLFWVAEGLTHEPPQPPAADLAKNVAMERPAKRVLAQSSPLPLSQRTPAAVEQGESAAARAAVEGRNSKPAQMALPGRVWARRGAATDGPQGPRDGEAPLGRLATRPPRATFAAARPPQSPVPPGKVVWHPDFASACAASRKSGKPVLYFQLLGNLDDRFC